MTGLNMYPTWSFVRIKATYTNRMPSGGISYAPFRHFVLLKKYIVYGQGPIACIFFEVGIPNLVCKSTLGLQIPSLGRCVLGIDL